MTALEYGVVGFVMPNAARSSLEECSTARKASKVRPNKTRAEPGNPCSACCDILRPFFSGLVNESYCTKAVREDDYSIVRKTQKL